MAKKPETRRRFTKEFKEEAVRLLIEEERPISEVSRNLDVHEGLLYKWKQAYIEDPEQAFPGHGKLKARDEEIRRLRRALRDAQEERDILKKAISIFSRPPQEDTDL